MRFKWLTVLQQSLAVLGKSDAPPHRFARFDLGVCDPCKRLRSVASLRCQHCGSERPVKPDA